MCLFINSSRLSLCNEYNTFQTVLNCVMVCAHRTKNCCASICLSSQKYGGEVKFWGGNFKSSNKTYHTTRPTHYLTLYSWLKSWFLEALYRWDSITLKKYGISQENLRWGLWMKNTIGMDLVLREWMAFEYKDRNGLWVTFILAHVLIKF